MRIGIMLPIAPGEISTESVGDLRTAEEAGVGRFWLRDWPVPTGRDIADGFDPIFRAGLLSRDCSATAAGFAALQLGYRTPQVLARALTGIEKVASAPPMVGLGGKGLPDDGSASLARSWEDLIAALDAIRAVDPLCAEPSHSSVLLLCSDDPARWEAIDWRAKGWMTGQQDPRKLAAMKSLLAKRACGDHMVLHCSWTVDAADESSFSSGPDRSIRMGSKRLRQLTTAYANAGVDELILSPVWESSRAAVYETVSRVKEAVT
jgi:hypothetical protein